MASLGAERPDRLTALYDFARDAATFAWAGGGYCGGSGFKIPAGADQPDGGDPQ
jgi:hypothetical protein